MCFIHTMEESCPTDTEKYLTTKRVSEMTGLPLRSLRSADTATSPESMTLGRKRVVYKLSNLT